MLDTMMKVSLTLVAIDKMSRVIRDAVSKSETEFDRLQKKINQTSERLDKLGQNMTKVGAGLTAVGTGIAYKLGITEQVIILSFINQFPKLVIKCRYGACTNICNITHFLTTDFFTKPPYN